MPAFKLSILLIILSVSMGFGQSQKLKGYVYDEDASVKGCTILNVTSSAKTYTDNLGYFELLAAEGDSLVFSSLFHSKLTVVLDKTHFLENQVFVLKSVVNQLDEVLLTDTQNKRYNTHEFNTKLSSIIQEDIKRNSHLYGINASQYGVDFVYLYKLVAGLFKKKPTYKESPLNYNNLKELFESSGFFTEDLLTESMGIAKDQKFLFLEFCSLRRIDSSLARKEREMELLDTLMLRSIEFKQILSEATKKD